MATPNLLALTSVKPGLVMHYGTTSLVDIIDVPANHCYEINSIQVANSTTTTTTTMSIKISNDNGSSSYYLADAVQAQFFHGTPSGYASYSGVWAAGTHFTFPIYLDETDLLSASCSVANAMHFIISYEDMTDE